MRLHNLSPMLYTNDIEESVDFYVRQLGFECKALEAEQGWASVKLGDIRIMFSRPNAHMYFEHPFFTGSFYFNMDNVADLWDKLKDEVQICYPLEDFEYGMREFAVYDNNGYLLQFGQDLNTGSDTRQQVAGK